MNPEKPQMLDATNESNPFTGNPAESAILSEISTMKPGESGTVGDVIFVTGKAYSSASGLRCKTVTINGYLPESDAKNRVACDDGKAWFFIRDVFKGDDSDVESNVMEIEMVNTTIGSLR